MIEIDENEPHDIPEDFHEKAFCFYEGKSKYGNDGYILYGKGICLDADIHDSGRSDAFSYLTEDGVPPTPGFWVWEGHVRAECYQTEDGADFEPHYVTEVWRGLNVQEWSALMANESPFGESNANQ